MNDLPDSALAHVIFAGKLWLRDIACCVSSANSDNVLCCQFCRATVFAAAWVITRPAFLYTVGVVVGVSTKEEVLRVAARRVVAAMTDNQSFWYRAIG